MTIKELYDIAKENDWLDYDVYVNNECGDVEYATQLYKIERGSRESVMIE